MYPNDQLEDVSHAFLIIQPMSMQNEIKFSVWNICNEIKIKSIKQNHVCFVYFTISFLE